MYIVRKNRRSSWLWKGAVLVLLIPSLALIPGVPHPFVHAFLWFTPIPARMEPSSLEDGPERILIIAPHPDDEVLAVGGTIAQLVKEGHSVLIAFLTNGDANRATKRLLTFSPLHRATDYYGVSEAEGGGSSPWVLRSRPGADYLSRLS